MNKKFDRVLQWGKEKMGNDNKTATTDEFKTMEMEMQMRQEGMERLHTSASTYIKSLSKRREGDDREKMIPVDIVGQAMVMHGEEFESDSLYGQCLTSFGRAHESIARVQDSYVQNINDNWLLGLERNLAQMKEYQAARKKLESRRLAFDATQSKMQKLKKEDFRLEDEMRSQRIKYEESSDEVLRRMNDIRDAEEETLADLSAFLDAELEYYDKCRSLLMRVKEQWPAQLQGNKQSFKKNRSRSNTAHSFNNGFRDREIRERDYEEPAPPQPERPSIRSRGVSASHGSASEWDEHRRPTPDLNTRQSSWKLGGESLSRTSSHDSSAGPARMLRTVTEPMPPPLPATRGGLRPVITRTASYNSHKEEDVFADENHSPESPASSIPKLPSRNSSSNSLSGAGRKVAPPPPPVSRGVVQGKKPPPPPPPVKRANLSNLSIHDNA
ncbi:Endophilin-A2 [Dactylella cylindrospora]|nr:Endophilin-A2 [Dactylella cylindrospora]